MVNFWREKYYEEKNISTNVCISNGIINEYSSKRRSEKQENNNENDKNSDRTLDLG